MNDQSEIRNPKSEIVIDAHLDLSFNALRGRDVLCPAAEQPADETGIASVGVPDLLAGGVGLICGTIFCEPAGRTDEGYHNPDEAHAAGMTQLRWYHQHADVLPIVRRTADLPDKSGRVHNLILLEGADPIRTPDEASLWFDQGVRIVGLAWRQTRYAGGTGCPGPLTPGGTELVKALDVLGMIHDASHLAEESFWQLLELSGGPVMASHSNCRAIVPGDRQLSDDMIRAIVSRGGMIGANFFDRFLLPPDQQGKRRATLNDVVLHIRHIAELTGRIDCIGLGTDMDGGLGREQIPQEIRSSADLPRVGEALERAGFDAAATAGILGDNWRRFFTAHLPR